MDERKIRMFERMARVEYQSYLGKAVLVRHIDGFIEDGSVLLELDLDVPLSVVVEVTYACDVLRFTDGPKGWGGWVDPVFKVRINECVCPPCTRKKNLPQDLGDMNDLTVEGVAYCLDGRVSKSDVVGFDPRGVNPNFPKGYITVS